MSAIRRLPLLATALMALGCNKTIDEPVPTPPDMSALVSAYDDPQGRLTADTLPDMIESALEMLESVVNTGSLSILFDAIGGLAGFGETSGALMIDGPYAERGQLLAIGGVEIDGAGFLRIRRICEGWDDSTTPNEGRDGVIEFTSTFNDAGLDPVVWGAMTGCRYRFGESELELTGGLNIHLGSIFEDLTDPEIGAAEPILIEFDLSFLFEMIGAPLGALPTDLRLSIDGSVELRLSTPGGGDIIFITDGSFVGFRAANGLWTCDFDLGACNDGTGNTFPF
jgi:hypothetical protein